MFGENKIPPTPILCMYILKRYLYSVFVYIYVHVSAKTRYHSFKCTLNILKTQDGSVFHFIWLCAVGVYKRSNDKIILRFVCRGLMQKTHFELKQF